MRTTPNFGEQINAWHEEWQASKDLRFQFTSWTAYAFGRRLRAVWDASPDLQRQYDGDFRAFSTATKKHASDAAAGARDKSSRDAAKRTAEHAKRHGTVGIFLRNLMSKPLRTDK